VCNILVLAHSIHFNSNAHHHHTADLPTALTAAHSTALFEETLTTAAATQV